MTGHDKPESPVTTNQNDRSRSTGIPTVDGLNEFLLQENGKKLINVALSRAQAKLILMLSDRDLRNPMFALMLDVVEEHVNRPIKPIEQVLGAPDYLTSAVGERVAINGQVAEIVKFSSTGGAMWVVMEATGLETVLNTQDFR